MTGPDSDPAPVFDFFGALMDYECGNSSEDEVIALFQYILDNDLHCSLQGHYGRTVHALMAAGHIQRKRRG